MTPEPPSRDSHIAPLFWHHGESAEIIVREIDAMRASGIREFVLEPRPHPDYLGAQWWSDVDVVLAASRERDMRVWLFDDARFPSGWLNGELVERHPHMRKRYLAESHIDVRGPLPGASFAVRPWLQDDDSLHAVVVARRIGDDELDSETLLDVTPAVVDGTLYWDVPAGRWRVVVVTETGRGHEKETVDYLNPIAAGAADLHLSTVHQRHYDRYSADFGGLIAGFFQDEPRFGNAATYEFRLGSSGEKRWGGEGSQVLPCSELLDARLRDRMGDAHRRLLPLLWWSGDPELTARTRFAYMDTVTRLYEAFQRRLGEWCEEHGVSLIGHVVEDNGAHARLGYGAGHYFRAMSGQHMGGIDLVQHVLPGAMSGRRAGSFGAYDDDFYFWGLAKLASSAAHIDPRKRGLAMCEAFGAYGWHEGLRLMKWLTDHLAVRGVNFLVPHAFSALVWDEDCPPHFFNGGLNPQWKHFALWREYAQRLSDALSGGQHHSDAAVLYHAEAEWAGYYMPFERVLAELMVVQRDADVVPIEAVVTAEVVAGGAIRIGGETYPILVVPFAERIPAALARAIVDRGIRAVFVDGHPHAFSDAQDDALLDALRRETTVVGSADLRGVVEGPVSTSGPEPDLRIMRYTKPGRSTVFAVNESTASTVDTTLTIIGETGAVVLIDPLTDNRVQALASASADGLAIGLRLEPGESRLLEIIQTAPDLDPPAVWRHVGTLPPDGWKIGFRSFDAAEFAPQAFSALGPANVPGRLPRGAGTLRYEITTDLSGADAIELGGVGETAEVMIEGVSTGVRIAAPYRFELPPGLSWATLTVDVTTTLAPAMATTNVFDATVALEPTGLVGPVSLERRTR